MHQQALRLLTLILYIVFARDGSDNDRSWGAAKEEQQT